MIHLRQSCLWKGFGIALFAGGLVISGGCTQQGRWTQGDYHLSYGAPLQDRESLSRPLPDSDLEDLSARIYLISDNQRHELLGDGVDLFRTGVSDDFVACAIRPPQLDFFGQDLLREALEMSDGFALHLGDACDISNTGEFGKFAWDMRLASHGWVMAPGNHDGFFFGNSSRTWDSLIQEWNDSAEEFEYDGAMITSRAMQKDRYVSYYLAALVLQEAVWSGPLARSLGPECRAIFATWTREGESADARSFRDFWLALEALQEAIYQGAELESNRTYHEFELTEKLASSGQPHLRRVAWHIDKKNLWKSFILQEVDISGPAASSGNDDARISILVLDTAHYGFLPGLDAGLFSGLANLLTLGFFDQQIAGVHGNILKSQEDATTAFATSMKAEGRRWLLASHHPYKDLGRATGPRFDRVRDEGGIPVTLSAHSHAGKLVWQHDGDREGAWIEINVGSLLDAPVEFRDFQVRTLGDRVAISSHRMLMADLLREQDLLNDDVPGYRPSPGDADYYLDYRSRRAGTAHEVDFTVKRILLAAILRMLRLFEADAPDQSATRWPIGPEGTSLRSHDEVIEAVQRMLVEADISKIEELTRFLYELREFDRTRAFTDATAQRMRSYRLSQAIWATRAELTTRGHAAADVDPDISLILLPRPATETSSQQPSHASAP